MALLGNLKVLLYVGMQPDDALEAVQAGWGIERMQVKKEVLQQRAEGQR